MNNHARSLPQLNSFRVIVMVTIWMCWAVSSTILLSYITHSDNTSNDTKQYMWLQQILFQCTHCKKTISSSTEVHEPRNIAASSGIWIPALQSSQCITDWAIQLDVFSPAPLSPFDTGDGSRLPIFQLGCCLFGQVLIMKSHSSITNSSSAAGLIFTMQLISTDWVFFFAASQKRLWCPWCRPGRALGATSRMKQANRATHHSPSMCESAFLSPGPRHWQGKAWFLPRRQRCS